MPDSSPHSERVREALDYALLRVGRELGYYDDILMYRGGKEALDSLEEQLQIARDAAGDEYHRAERLKEQLETLQAAIDAYWGGDDTALLQLRLSQVEET